MNLIRYRPRRAVEGRQGQSMACGAAARLRMRRFFSGPMLLYLDPDALHFALNAQILDLQTREDFVEVATSAPPIENLVTAEPPEEAAKIDDFLRRMMRPR